jgi:hypothetical protein
MAVLMRGSITKREQAGRGMRVNDPAGIAPRNGQHSAEVVAHWRESVEPQSKSSPAHHRNSLRVSDRYGHLAPLRLQNP